MLIALHHQRTRPCISIPLSYHVNCRTAVRGATLALGAMEVHRPSRLINLLGPFAALPVVGVLLPTAPGVGLSSNHFSHSFLTHLPLFIFVCAAFATVW